jgi:hypothetical protein
MDQVGMACVMQARVKVKKRALEEHDRFHQRNYQT